MEQMLVSPGVLLDKLDSSTVAYHKYLDKKNNHSLFCFFEGRYDIDYYFDKIRLMYGEDFIDIDCHNKKNVLNVYDTISEYDHLKYKLAFFVDHDYEPFIDNPHIFETDRYSIENYYCTIDVFTKILEHEFKIDTVSDDYNKACTFFKDKFTSFHDAVGLYNAFCYSVSNNKIDHDDKFFDGDMFPKEFILINNDYTVNATYNLENLRDKYKISQKMIADEVIMNNFEKISSNPFGNYRGKNEIKFFIQLLCNLIRNANSCSKNKIIKSKVKFTINCVTFMSNYSKYADIPDSLKDYLKSFKEI